MKKLLLFLLFSFNAFSQSETITYERFLIENNKIIWQKTYQKDSIYIAEKYKKIPKLNFTKENSGFVKDEKLNCKGLAIYMNSAFGFYFTIEEKETKFRITVSEINFEDNIQIDFGGVTNTNKVNTLSEFELRTSDNTFRKNTQSKKNLECLDKFLLDFFELKPEKDW